MTIDSNLLLGFYVGVAVGAVGMALLGGWVLWWVVAKYKD